VVVALKNRVGKLLPVRCLPPTTRRANADKNLRRPDARANENVVVVPHFEKRSSACCGRTICRAHGSVSTGLSEKCAAIAYEAGKTGARIRSAKASDGSDAVNLARARHSMMTMAAR